MPPELPCSDIYYPYDPVCHHRQRFAGIIGGMVAVRPRHLILK